MPVRSPEEPRFTRASARLGLVAAAIGCASAAGTFALDGLQRALPGLGTLRFASSFGIALCGLALLALQRPPSHRLVRWAGRAAAAVGATLGAGALLQTLLGHAPPWMSVPGAIGLILAGSAIVLAASPRASRSRPAEVLAGGAAAIGLLGLLGHVYRLEDLYRLGATPMAPWTALGVGLLGAAGLVARSEFGLARVLEGRSVGAAHFRRALPALLGIPLAASFAAMAGVRLGVWDLGWAFAFFTLASMTALGVVGAVHARRLDLLVRERRRLESASISDVTARRRAEADLGLLQRALACSSDAVIVAEAAADDGRIVYVNPAFTRITGYEPEDAFGRGWSFLGERPEAEPALGELCRRMQPDDSVEVLLRTRRKNGETLWSQIRIAPVVDSASGEVTHHVGIQEDVTEKLQVTAERERLLAEAVEARAEAERAGRAKDEFFALISHELRSPLGAITGWLAVLRRDTPTEVRARALEVVQRNSALLTRLIGDLLDASRIASGKLEIERAPVDVLDVVRNAVTAQEPAAREREVTLAFEASDEPAHVEGDAERLDQVVRNLIGNALKFTPPGGRIDVVLRRQMDLLRLEVRDTGQGIPKDVLPHVFERFRQADGGTRGADRGLGLGLSIVRHLVELHGGRVEATSEGPGLGAAFSVQLPASPLPRTLAASPVRRGPDALEGICVLLLESDRAIAEGRAIALEAAAADVAWVKSAAEALAQSDVLHPHVLVADLDSCGDDAANLVHELRRGGPAGSRFVASIAISTAGTLASRRAARETGFDGYLARPFEPAQLVALIRSLVARPTRVLVVDDDPASADSLALLLSRRGFEVERAYDADAALAAAPRFRPDVVVADLQLGATSGVELAAALRTSGGRLRILAVSGRSREELGADAELFDGFVRKPVELDALLALLDAR